MSNVENLSPQIIRQVIKEMQNLQMNPLEGIKVAINEADVLDIQAVIEGPAGNSDFLNLGRLWLFILSLWCRYTIQWRSISG